MKIDARITCRQKPYGIVCDWHGGKVAELGGDSFRYLVLQHKTPIVKRIKAGEIYEFGHLRLRVIAFPLFNGHGAGCDTAAVMLESPHAQLYWLYRKSVERLLRVVVNVEARIRGFMLRPVEGKTMPLASKLANALL